VACIKLEKSERLCWMCESHSLFQFAHLEKPHPLGSRYQIHLKRSLPVDAKPHKLVTRRGDEYQDASGEAAGANGTVQEEVRVILSKVRINRVRCLKVFGGLDARIEMPESMGSILS
jgi:hypothetical protein